MTAAVIHEIKTNGNSTHTILTTNLQQLSTKFELCEHSQSSKQGSIHLKIPPFSCKCVDFFQQDQHEIPVLKFKLVNRGGMYKHREYNNFQTNTGSAHL